MTDALDDVGELTDEELVARARAGVRGSARCLERLLDRHRSSIFRRCLSIIGHPDDAEDVTQEVLVRIFRGLDGYQGLSSFRTWLYTIVQNECSTFTARRERQSIPDEIRMQMKLHFGLESHIRTRTVSREQLHTMFLSMPHQARDIVQLRYLREMSLPTIARLLGMSLSATKMRLYRALSLGQQLMNRVMARPRQNHSVTRERLGGRIDRAY